MDSVRFVISNRYAQAFNTLAPTRNWSRPGWSLGHFDLHLEVICASVSRQGAGEGDDLRMLPLTLLLAFLAYAHPDPGASARLMSLLGQSLNHAVLALAQAEHAPLTDAAIAAAVAQLEVGIAAARHADPGCEPGLLPAAARAWPADQRDAFAAAYRDDMRRFAAALRAHADEFAAQGARSPLDRTTTRLRAQAAGLKDLVREAHRDLKALTRQIAPRA